MKTISIGIHNPCVPCSCACKYCLLQSCKEAEGIDYYRGKKLAERFIVWAKNKNITPCLLYTSDAADDLLRVDLGGHRIIKKKKKRNKT